MLALYIVMHCNAIHHIIKQIVKLQHQLVLSQQHFI